LNVRPQGQGAPEAPEGNDGPQSSQGETSGPNYVTEGKLNELVNRAITARFSAFEKKFGNQISESVASLIPKFEELVQAKLPAKEAANANSGDRLEESPFVKGLQKKLAELEDQTRRAQAERDTERARARDVALRQKLSEELARNGIDSRYAKQAIGFLVDAEKRVRWEDDGDAIVFRDADGSEIDLQTGLRSWAKTDDAKIYQSPRGVTGSGDRGGGVAAKAAQGNGVKRGDLSRLLMSTFGPNGSGTE